MPEDRLCIVQVSGRGPSKSPAAQRNSQERHNQRIVPVVSHCGSVIVGYEK